MFSIQDLRSLIRAALLARMVSTLPSLTGARPPDPVVQHRNPAANARRKVKAEIGARQYRKQRKALAQLARDL